MTHAFMYPRVTQIAPRAHSVPASSLGAHLQPGTRHIPGGPAATVAAMTAASGLQAPGGRS
jgi:anti-sigma factor RsiW